MLRDQPCLKSAAPPLVAAAITVAAHLLCFHEPSYSLMNLPPVENHVAVRDVRWALPQRIAAVLIGAQIADVLGSEVAGATGVRAKSYHEWKVKPLQHT